MKLYLVKNVKDPFSLDWVETNSIKEFPSNRVHCRLATVAVNMVPFDNEPLPSDIEKCILLRNLLEKKISAEQNRFTFVLQDWFWFLNVTIGVSEVVNSKGSDDLKGFVKFKSNYQWDFLNRLGELFPGTKAQVELQVLENGRDDAATVCTILTKQISMDRDDNTVFQDYKLVFPEATREIWMAPLTTCYARITIAVTIPDDVFANFDQRGISGDSEGILPLAHDLTIMCSEGVKIEANRGILTERSSVFAAMFANDIKDSRWSTLEISDMKEKSARGFLKYMYHNFLSDAEEDIEIALELLQAGIKYQVLCLGAKMKKLILSTPNHWIKLNEAIKLFQSGWNIIPPDEALMNKAAIVIKLYAASLEESQAMRQLIQTDCKAGVELLKFVIQIE